MGFNGAVARDARINSEIRRFGSCRHTVMPQIFRGHPFLCELPLELIDCRQGRTKT
jgi:hypothetical protein